MFELCCTYRGHDETYGHDAVPLALNLLPCPARETRLNPCAATSPGPSQRRSIHGQLRVRQAQFCRQWHCVEHQRMLTM
jgi:hypothetical protein